MSRKTDGPLQGPYQTSRRDLLKRALVVLGVEVVVQPNGGVFSADLPIETKKRGGKKIGVSGDLPIKAGKKAGHKFSGPNKEGAGPHPKHPQAAPTPEHPKQATNSQQTFIPQSGKPPASTSAKQATNSQLTFTPQSGKPPGSRSTVVPAKNRPPNAPQKNGQLGPCPPPGFNAKTNSTGPCPGE